MARKFSHLNSNQSKPLLSRSSKRKLLRLVLAMAATGAAAVLIKPELISNQSQREKVVEVREKILSFNEQSQEQLLQKLPEVAKTISSLSTRLPQSKDLSGKDIHLDKLAEELNQKLQGLPQDKLEEIKKEFCQGIGEE